MSEQSEVDVLNTRIVEAHGEPETKVSKILQYLFVLDLVKDGLDRYLTRLQRHDGSDKAYFHPAAVLNAYAAVYKDLLDPAMRLVVAVDFFTYWHGASQGAFKSPCWKTFQAYLEGLFNEDGANPVVDISGIARDRRGGPKGDTGGPVEQVLKSIEAATPPSDPPAAAPKKKGRRAKTTETADLPGQQQLPLADDAEEPKAGDWTGKMVLYRGGAKPTAMHVLKDLGERLELATEVEPTKKWLTVARAVCKLVKYKGDGTPEPPELGTPDFTVTVPTAHADAWKAHLASGEHVIATYVEGEEIDSLSFPLEGTKYEVFVSLVNGAKKGPGPHIDVIVQDKERILFECPPALIVAGTYAVVLDKQPKVLEVKVEGT